MGYMRVIWRWLTDKKVLRVHCWADKDGGGSTCMLLDGHWGPHRWTPDTDILITFPTAEKLMEDLRRSYERN